jgi:hypothetical protein
MLLIVGVERRINADGYFQTDLSELLLMEQVCVLGTVVVAFW